LLWCFGENDERSYALLLSSSRATETMVVVVAAVGGSRVDEDEGVWVDGICTRSLESEQTNKQTNKQTIALSEFGSDNIQTSF